MKTTFNIKKGSNFLLNQSNPLTVGELKRILESHNVSDDYVLHGAWNDVAFEINKMQVWHKLKTVRFE